MRLPERSAGLVSAFIETIKNLRSIFLTIRMQRLKTIGAYTESTDLIFKNFQLYNFPAFRH
jgi:hypothetical protein